MYHHNNNGGYLYTLIKVKVEAEANPASSFKWYEYQNQNTVSPFINVHALTCEDALSMRIQVHAFIKNIYIKYFNEDDMHLFSKMKYSV